NSKLTVTNRQPSVTNCIDGRICDDGRQSLPRKCSRRDKDTPARSASEAALAGSLAALRAGGLFRVPEQNERRPVVGVLVRPLSTCRGGWLLALGAARQLGQALLRLLGGQVAQPALRLL